MNKKLSAKVQQLNPPAAEEAVVFSACVVVEPEDKNLLLRKGSLYAVFAVSGGVAFHTALIKSIVADVIQNAYFSADSVSAIQSLEKAISDVREKLESLSATEAKSGSGAPSFDMVAGVLWGNVLYIVKYGKGQGFLMRSGEIRPINTMSEGSYSAASGVLRDDDVVMLLTESFGRDYPPEKLLSLSLKEDSLKADQACILLKFVVDATFTEEEVIDFGVQVKAVKKLKLPAFITELPGKIKAKVQSMKRKREANVSTISSEPVANIRLRRQTGKFKLKPVFLIIAVALALTAAIAFTVYKKRTPPVVKSKETEEVKGTQVVDQAALQKAQDEKDKTVRLKPEVFYDLKITDETAEPTEIAQVGSNVVVVDEQSGKVFVSLLTTPKFEVTPTLFAGIHDIDSYKGNLSFVDSEGYKVYDLANDKVVETYKKEGLGVTAIYSDFVYSLAGGAISRYAKADGELKGSLWAQSTDFTDVLAMRIAYNIYLLRNDNVLSYTSGVKNSFSLSELPKPLANPKQIYTTLDLDNLFIVDAGNNRVVVVDKNGKYLRQYKAETDADWGNLRGVFVTTDQKTLFLLNGSRVLEVEFVAP